MLSLENAFSEAELREFEERLHRFLHDDSKQIVTDHYMQRRRGENPPSRYEASIVRKNGEIRDAEISATVIKNSKGQIKTAMNSPIALINGVFFLSA